MEILRVLGMTVAAALITSQAGYADQLIAPINLSDTTDSKNLAPSVQVQIGVGPGEYSCVGNFFDLLPGCFVLFHQIVTTSDVEEIVKIDRKNYAAFGSLASLLNTGGFNYFESVTFSDGSGGGDGVYPLPAILGPIVSVTISITRVCVDVPPAAGLCGFDSGEPISTYVYGTVTAQTTPEPSSGVFALMGVGLICHMGRRNMRRVSGKPPGSTTLTLN